MGRKSGDRSSENRRSMPSRAFSASRSATDLYLKKVATSHQRTEDRGQRTDGRTDQCLLTSVLYPLSSEPGGSRKNATNAKNPTAYPTNGMSHTTPQSVT